MRGTLDDSELSLRVLEFIFHPMIGPQIALIGRFISVDMRHVDIAGKWSLLPKVPIFETKKLALRVAKSKF